MIRRFAMLGLAITTGACASYDQVSKGWIGDTAEHLVATRGQPNAVLHHDDGSTTIQFRDVFHVAAPPAVGAAHSATAMTGPPSAAMPDWAATAGRYGVSPMASPGMPPSNPTQQAAWMAAEADYSGQVAQAQMARAEAQRTPQSAGNLGLSALFARGDARPCTTSFTVDAAGTVTDVTFAGPGCSWPVGKLLDAHYFPIPRSATVAAASH